MFTNNIIKLTMAMMKQYFEELQKYKKQYGDKVILMWQCGHFFEIYGLKDKQNNKFIDSNIIEFGNICDYLVKPKKTSSKGGKREQKYKHIDGRTYTVYMAGLPIFGNREAKISKLNEYGYTVAVWKQVENMKDVREEEGVHSPGTKFFDTNVLTNNIMCIYLKTFHKTTLTKQPKIYCGLSVIDIITGDTIFYQYESNYWNESINFDEIERFYSIYNPSEIIIIHNFESNHQIENMVTYSVIDCETKHIFKIDDEDCAFNNEIKNCGKQTYQEECLLQFFDFEDSDFFYAEYAGFPYATSSFCFLLNFVYKHNKNLVKNIKKPIFDNNESMMLLANHSLKQLNIINKDSTKKIGSVNNFLNVCVTSMGRREFTKQLLHPITDEETLINSYNIIDYLKKKEKLLENVKRIKNLTDMEKFYRKIILEKSTPFNMYSYNNNLKNVFELCKDMSKNKTLCKFFDTLNINVKTVQKYSKKIIDFLKTHLLMNVCSDINTINMDENIFQPNIYESIDEALSDYEKSDLQMNCILEYLNEVLRRVEKNNKNGIKLITPETRDPYINMTSRRAGNLDSELHNIHNHYPEKTLKFTYNGNNENLIFDINSIEYVDSTKNNKKLESVQLTKLCEVICKGKDKIRKEVRSCYKLFMQSCISYSKEMEYISNFVKHFDVICAKAFVAIKYNYCKPEIVKHHKSFYDAKDLRHVLIEHIQKKEIYVPNDLELGKSKDGVMLYGTNAVGKSSLIKSIGICIIMAQSGMFVPCSNFHYKPYKAMYTRILGNDDIFKGLSSFAVEMSELKSILNCNKDSLILGDELCRGTENNSALRILVAGLMELNKIGCSHIFATHFHEITNMKEIKNLNRLQMKHLSISYNKELQTLIYDRKLKDGSGTSDYGLLVCKSLGFKDEFIKIANDLEIKIEIKNDNILSNNVTSYNSSKIKGKCEICGDSGIDVDHMIAQCKSDNDGNINFGGYIFNKNHPANLQNLCKECHKKKTKEHIMYVRKKTLKGYKTIECN